MVAHFYTALTLRGAFGLCVIKLSSVLSSLSVCNLPLVEEEEEEEEEVWRQRNVMLIHWADDITNIANGLYDVFAEKDARRTHHFLTTCILAHPEMTRLFFLTSQKLTTRSSFGFPDIGGQYSLISMVNLSWKISVMNAQLRIKKIGEWH